MSLYRVIDAFSDGNILASRTAAQNATALQTLIDANTNTGAVIWFAEPVPMDPFHLKSNIQLRGNNWAAYKGSTPDAGASPSLAATPSGASFLINDEDDPLITMESNTSVDGIIMHYPDQNYTATTIAGTTEYPVTITKGSGKVEGVSLTNICFVGATACVKLVGTGLSDFVADMKLEKLYGYPLGGSMLELGYVLDINHTNCIHVNPGVGFQFLGDANGIDNVPYTDDLIDDIVANGADCFVLDHHDSIMMSQIFAFATRTTMRITASYGKIVNFESDQCTTGLYYTGAAHKDLQLIGFRAVPSAGPTPSGRNGILFDGGGYLSVIGGTGDLGNNSAVPSSAVPSANAFIKCSGGVLDVTDCRTTSQSGSWSNQIEQVGGTTISGSVGTW